MKLRPIIAPRQSIPVRLATFLAVAGFLVAGAVLPPSRLIPTASASCSPIEVVFARGRLESPGAGVIGNSFVSALRSRVNRNVSLYAVRYPADTEVDIGANDMSAHVQNTINGCPDTRIVLGGYSLGAAVTDVVMAAPIAAFGFTNPLPPGSDQHIAAVALFGNGSQWVGPITNFNPVYTDRTIDMCHGADPVCNPADPHTWNDNWAQHSASQYIQAGMVDQAADFVAGKLQ
jgi:cutinase